MAAELTARTDMSGNQPWFSVESNSLRSKLVALHEPVDSDSTNCVEPAGDVALADTVHAKYVLSVAHSSRAPPP